MTPATEVIWASNVGMSSNWHSVRKTWALLCAQMNLFKFRERRSARFARPCAKVSSITLPDESPPQTRSEHSGIPAHSCLAWHRLSKRLTRMKSPSLGQKDFQSTKSMGIKACQSWCLFRFSRRSPCASMRPAAKGGCLHFSAHIYSRMHKGMIRYKLRRLGFSGG